MAAKQPSAAVLAARARRAARAEQVAANLQWYTDNVVSQVEMTLRQRVALAAEFLRSKIVTNISRPVTKLPGGKATDRSKPGEFPKADTTQLMKTIFWEVSPEQDPEIWAIVGTPLDYGLILEVSSTLNRTYLKRTLLENLDTVKAMLTGPIT